MKVSVIGCSTTWSDRPTSSYCINDNILVDAGEGTFKYYNAAKVDFEKIKYIFITHFHSDHTFAVINHIYNAIWHYNHNEKKVIYIFGPKGVKTYFKNLRDIILPEYKDFNTDSFIKIREITNFDTKIKIENLEVSFFKLKHENLQDIAYVFDDGKVKVGFSGDCTYTPELDKFVEKANVLYLECCDLKTNDKHLGYDKYFEYMNNNKDKTFYAIHCENKIYDNAAKLGISVAKSGQINEHKNFNNDLTPNI